MAGAGYDISASLSSSSSSATGATKFGNVAIGGANMWTFAAVGIVALCVLVYLLKKK